MPVVPLILLILGFLLLCLAAWLAPEPRPFSRLACMGLAAWVASEIVMIATKH